MGKFFAVSESSKIWVIFLVLFVVFDYAHTKISPCQGRKILNSTSGVITDGHGKYPKASQCEWLITAPNPNMFINLEFHLMETECSYDFLFVYDGDSFNSPLLGSFSGSTLPDKLTASSGNMVVYFFSDRNYVIQGFNATYTITDCPYNCRPNGACSGNKCVCNADYKGDFCQYYHCQDNCVSPANGNCDLFEGYCVCEEGYVGHSCSLRTKSNSGNSEWYTLYPEGYQKTTNSVVFPKRTGHAGAFIEDTKTFWVYGGVNFGMIIDDLMYYDFASSSWENATQNLPSPSGRHSHTMVSLGTDLYIFGGVLEDGILSNELWKYKTDTNQWELVSIEHPMGLVGHSMTLVDSKWIYVFGGRRGDGRFMSSMYRIDVVNGGNWEAVQSTGGKDVDRQLIGHSAVFHKESRSLLIFGGISKHYARNSNRNNFIHAFHVDNKYWSQIYYKKHSVDNPVPNVRAFHTAHIIGNYMVVYGGSIHKHEEEELCYDNGMYLYHLGCHTWVNITSLEEFYRGVGNVAVKPAKGRISHVAAVAFEDILLINGGYRGNVLGDLIAYKFPPSVAHNKDVLISNNASQCPVYDGKVSCLKDPECVWCEKINVTNGIGCISRTQKQSCLVSVAETLPCPGLCASLQECGACTSQGRGADNITVQGLVYNKECGWCAKEAACQEREDRHGTCSPSEGTVSGVEGWWGSDSAFVTSISQCRTENYPAGLHFTKYKEPANLAQPDEVEIIRVTNQLLPFVPVIAEDIKGHYVGKFTGYIHPLGVNSSRSSLAVYLGGSSAVASLYISTDNTTQHLEKVADLPNSGVYSSYSAMRQNDAPLFPNEQRGASYYMEQIANRTISNNKYNLECSMVLQWSAHLGGNNQASQTLHDLTSEFLQPYSNGNCSGHPTCLACMTDVQCGWCPSSNTCECREDTSLDAGHCGTADPDKHLIVNATNCVVCADYVECLTCAQDPYCEWLSKDGRCFRKGRFEGAVRNVSSCPIPCTNRSSCYDCVEDGTECAWCFETSQCFPFSEYVTRHITGTCHSWVDHNTAAQCKDCSTFTTCGSCTGSFQCGWCGNIDNPTIGSCIAGDFSGPYDQANCSSVIESNYNVSDSADWSYGECPDVEECKLGLDDCHDNATCINTHHSYECKCNRGFIGNGKDKCDKTCYYECIHGTCTGSPDYVCSCALGWTGDECNTNCGCHNHSTCSTGVGNCDECQQWTMGNTCELCKPGSYGDATKPQGCSQCACNGHGLESLGYCNNQTGTCYCQDSYEGDHCEKCAEGYYGNPSNGGKCYLKCEGRVLVANATSGALGSHRGSGVQEASQAYCLWFITPYATLEEAQSSSGADPIVFELEKEINLDCNMNYVYIYDGIPEFLSQSGGQNAVALGAFCGRTLTKPAIMKATSGIMVVYLHGKLADPNEGFNGSFIVHSCPDHCPDHSVCMSGQCECEEGYTGPQCDLVICPNNCSADLGQGHCEQATKLCVCNEGYTGSDCNTTVSAISKEHMSVLLDPVITGSVQDIDRMGHAIVKCNETVFYMVGGYSIKTGASMAVWSYSMVENAWTEIPATNTPPAGRWFHAAVCVPVLQAIYVLGGIVPMNGMTTVSDELWKYNLGSKRWNRIAVTVPPMAGHTMTLVSDTKVIIIGGFSAVNYFNNVSYDLDVSSNTIRAGWNGKTRFGAPPTGLYGHSAVFLESNQSMYVYGGYRYDTDPTVSASESYTRPSAELYALHLPTGLWSQLPSEYLNQPIARYFHSAVGGASYMTVMSGRTKGEAFTNTILAYRYACNHWMDIGSIVPHLRSNFQPRIASSAIMLSGAIYITGGFDGKTLGSVLRLNLPDDLCSLITNATTCGQTLGCSACTVTENGTDTTLCYSNDGTVPVNCLHHNATHHVGPKCDNIRIETRDCNQHKTCSKCLAIWPPHQNAVKACKWCSNCPTGKCIKSSENCNTVNPCGRQQRTFTSAANCTERMCQEADCQKCVDTGSCIWTRQIKRLSEVGRTLSMTPIYNWNCVSKTLLDATSTPIVSMPPETCPMMCYQHASCSSCLDSLGSEGGWKSCNWSEHLQECMTPAYQPLQCSNGICGTILSEKSSSCAVDCSSITMCSKCVENPTCGWCALGGLNGIGVCMAGGLHGPKYGLCSAVNVTLGDKPLPAYVANYTSSGAPTWAFTSCPEENECLNGHHSCDVNEKCVDLEQGYNCVCKQGYERNVGTNNCDPVCNGGHGCNHGTCVAPDNCQCHFGWVGGNCSTECDCNKHSNCKSVAEKDVCMQCLNNTQGNKCQYCKPFYVGIPLDGGSCISCLDHCNNHTSICVAVAPSGIWNQLPFDSDNFTESVNGPGANAVCVQCQDNTEGDNCEKCKKGYYRDSTDLKLPCVKCQCNGHSAFCETTTGGGCECANNTKTPSCGSDNDKPACKDVQCSMCNEYFTGKPTHGHQCFRMMSVEKDYCFDPVTQNDCTQNPRLLDYGKTVFFSVQPKYMNVDIRVTIDVTQGGADVYFSPKNDTFQVNVDEFTYLHNVYIDPKYTSDSRYLNSESSLRKRRSTVNSTLKNFPVQDIEAGTKLTHIVVTDRDAILLVRNIQFRLVITLPLQVHNLQTTRFFIVLKGRGNGETNTTFGYLLFRQDQPRIDLFVFFSVFFSCFFLFLSICVLMWKVKQIMDTRRMRHRRQMEMAHMASRPFSKVLVILDNLYPEIKVPLVKKHVLPRLRGRGRNTIDPDQIDDDHFGINPISIEPTDDGIAAVGTAVFQLPGGSTAPVQACIGSALMTMRVLYPTSNASKNLIRRHLQNINT